MRVAKKLFYLAAILTLGITSMMVPKTSAAFNRNKVMSDTVFSNVGTMSSSQIDSWLNTFPDSCISTNNGFASRDPTGYSPSGGYAYGGNVSAGRVIADAARAYGLNPQVLLATIQKEEGLVQGNGAYGCSALAITAAVGYGCPDGGKSYSYSGLNLYTVNGHTVTSISGTCVNSASKVGFSQQIIHAAWLLRFGQQRSLGNTAWNTQRDDYPQMGDHWDNSDDPPTTYGGPMTQGYRARVYGGSTRYYDGYTTIDGTSTHMDTGATAALYWYTPHFSGNQSFDNIFTNWFGSPTATAPYAWNVESQEIYSDAGRTKKFTSTPTVAPGGTVYVRVKAMNVGYKSWSQSFLHLGTSHPNDRHSIFYNGTWLNPARPAQMVESTVKSADAATFEFSMTAPANEGTYKEYFNVVADGIQWLNDPGMYYVINVVQPFPAKYTSADNTQITPGETLNPGDFLISPGGHDAFVYQKDGNVVLYNDFKASWNIHTAGKRSNRLVFQTDGNLVLYDGGTPVWATGTDGQSPTALKMQTDGNTVMYNGGTPLWYTGTKVNLDDVHHINTTLPRGYLFTGQQIETADGKYRLILQGDGNLVLYSGGKAMWSARTSGHISYLALQSDGNLVMYDDSGHPVWYTGTSGSRNCKLVMQADGNLVLYDGTKVKWHVNT